MSSQPQAHSPARGQRAPNPIEVLHQTLSAKHTEAPAADRHPHIGPLQPAPAGLLRVIGRGTCGTVYTSANPSTVAYKVGRDRDALWNDIQLTARVHDSIRDANVLLLPRVPAIKGWRDKIEHASSFEGGIHAGSLLSQLYPAKHVRLYYRSMSSPHCRPKRLRTRRTTSASYGHISD
jgi:hypothetical protein